jgi:predicted nucleotidyltransferase
MEVDVRLRSPLDAALATQGHVRVLRALNALPEGLAVSVRDLGRRAGLRHPRTSEILADLRLQGVATAQRAGRADLYQLNRAHVLYPMLRRLFHDEGASEHELIEALRNGLAPAARYIKEAYLFGSVARGESDATSDIDLAIVAPHEDAPVVTKTLLVLAAAVKQRFGNDLNVQVSSEPVAKRRRARDPSRELWDRVAREGVPVLPVKRASRA